MIQDNLHSQVRGVVVDHIRGLAIHDHHDFVNPAAEEIFHAPIHNPFSAHSLAQFLPPESTRQSRAKQNGGDHDGTLRNRWLEVKARG
jgi:hypothetical protein